MAKKFVSVEISDRIVKVSVSMGTEKKRKVKDAFLFEVSDEIIHDGVILDPSRFGTTLAREMESRKCGDAKEVYFTVASTKIVSREVNMPLMTDAKIADVVESNKAQYFPLELTDYLVRFRVLSREKKKSEKQGCNVVVMAMPKTVVNGCNAAATAGGLKLKGVDVLSSSMSAGVAMLKQTQVTAFVSVEPGSTNVCFMKGNELLLQRSVSYGGSDMIESYQDMSESSLSFMEALDDLTSLSAEDNVSGKLSDEDISELLEYVVGGVARSVDFFNTNKSGGLTQIVLLGTCSNLLGLEDMIEQASGISTMQLTGLAAAAQLRSISQTPGFYVAGMYAGHNGLNFGSDLDPKNQKSSKKNEIDLPTTILIVLLMFVFAVYWGYSTVLEHTALEEQLAKLNTEIDGMKYYDTIAATHQSYLDSKTNLLAFTDMTANPNENLVSFLAELEAKMPSEVLVLSATCTSVSVSMNFVVNSLVEAATVVSKLRSFESIGNIQVSGLSMAYVQFEGEGYSQAMQDGFEEVAFSVVCTYGTNAYMEGLNPYAGILGIPEVGGAVEEVPVA